MAQRLLIDRPAHVFFNAIKFQGDLMLNIYLFNLELRTH